MVSVTLEDSSSVVTRTVLHVYDVFDRWIARKHDTDGDSDIDESAHFLFDGEHVALSMEDDGDVPNRYLHGPAIDIVLADEQVGGDLLWTLAAR